MFSTAHAFFQAKNINLPSDLVLDGQIHRFNNSSRRSKDLSGFYCGLPQNFVYAGDFRFGPEATAVYKERETKRLTKAEKQVMAALKKALEDEQAKRREEGRAEALKLWERSRPTQGELHPYARDRGLKASQMRSLYRFDADTLVLPIYSFGGEPEDLTLQAVQRIYKSEGVFHKRFQGSPSGGFLPLSWPFDTNQEVYLCEGWSTALSVAVLFETEQVVCCYNVSNLEPVALALRERYPTLKLVIAADNDYNSEKPKENVGVDTSLKLSKKIPHCRVVVPPGETKKDFNDLLRDGHTPQTIKASFSTERIESMISDELIENEHYTLMGVGAENSKAILFYNKQLQQIDRFLNTEALKKGLTRLAPHDFWLRYFAKPKSPSTINKELAVDLLQEKGTKLGSIADVSTSRIHKYGAWSIDQTFYVNYFRELVAISPKNEISYPQRVVAEEDTFHLFYSLGGTNKTYNKTQAFPKDKTLQELILNPRDISFLDEVIGSFKWDKPKAHVVQVMGWIYTARLIDILPIRPRVWVTGPASSGKTQLIKVIRALFEQPKDSSKYLKGKITEPGLRQSLNQGNRPFIHDEAEGWDSVMTDLQNCLTLERGCYNKVELEQTYGSADQSGSVSYVVDTTVFRCSVAHAIYQMTDRERIFNPTFKGEKDPFPEGGLTKLKQFFKRQQDPSDALGLKLFFDAIYHRFTFLENYDTCFSYLNQVLKHPTKTLSARVFEQHATALASYMTFRRLKDHKALCDAYLNEVDVYHNDQIKEEDKPFDVIVAMIMNMKLRVGTDEMRVREALRRQKLSNAVRDELEAVGLKEERYQHKDSETFEGLFIRRSSPEIKKMFSSTPYAGTKWQSILLTEAPFDEGEGVGVISLQKRFGGPSPCSCLGIRKGLY